MHKWHWLSRSRKSWRGRTALVRLDLNAPVKNGTVADSTRIEAAVASGTLQYLIERGARIAILTHLGRYEPDREPLSTEILLEPLQARLNQALEGHRTIRYRSDVAGHCVMSVIENLQPGQVVLLGNSRFSADDERNDPWLTQWLGRIADCFVFDAFGVAHREQSSTTGVIAGKKRGQAYVGFLMEQEIAKLEPFTGTQSNSVACIGGAKLKEKIGAIEGLLKNGWTVILGGVPLNVALQVTGMSIGASVCTEGKTDYGPVMESLLQRYPEQILLPETVLIAAKDNPGGLPSKHGCSQWIYDQRLIVDFLPSVSMEAALENASRIIQAGPMGWYEHGHRTADTVFSGYLGYCPKALALGGDTAAAISFPRYSTGGGAAITYLTSGSLPILDL